ncbi:hypothetical protein [Nesterenkonia sp. AN1]|nr:hypothetical protein [Nesterenkonia sp. AN1]
MHHSTAERRRSRHAQSREQAGVSQRAQRITRAEQTLYAGPADGEL